MNTLTLITGGGRSGKSTYALQMTLGYQRKVFVATALAFDEEMRCRIEKHRAERGKEFRTIEEPLHLADALLAASGSADVVLIDCLTVWLGNLLHEHDKAHAALPEVDAFMAALRDPPCDVVLVTNEVGMGIVPENALARRFRDIVGRVNQEIAARADRVILMVSGLPVLIKPVEQSEC